MICQLLNPDNCLDPGPVIRMESNPDNYLTLKFFFDILKVPNSIGHCSEFALYAKICSSKMVLLVPESYALPPGGPALSGRPALVHSLQTYKKRVFLVDTKIPNRD